MEFIVDNYYNKNNPVNAKKFIDAYESTCIGIEYWLSTEIFQNDISRIIYATDDNAFRKRVELLDGGKNEDGEFKPEMLDLPFGIYSPAGDPEPDDQDISRKSISNSVTGIYFPEEDLRMRKIPTMQKFKAILFFNNKKALREAYQLLFWEKEPEYPIQFYDTIEWRNTEVKLPVFIKIDDLKTNSGEYKETDWLTKNEIYTITMEFTVRTYQLLINNIKKIFQLPMKFSNFIDTYEEDEEHIDYYTEQVILTWAGAKFKIDTDAENVNTDSEEYQSAKKVFDKNPYNLDTKRIPNDYTIDTITSYFEDYDVTELKTYLWNEELSTTTESVIDYTLSKPDNLESITFMIPTYEPIVITDKENTQVKFEGLSENSSYNMSITLKTKNGKNQYFNLKVSTKADPASKAPKKEKINYAAGLLGMHSY